jgi:dTDP-4-amino-4,6-dideoxygalactose transaminase
MTVDASERHQSSKMIFETYESRGFNYRMTDLQAAIGLEQLRKLPDIVRKRRALAQSYNGMLAAIPDISPQHEPAWARSNWQSYCVRLPLWANQQSIMQAMLDRGIATRRINCVHLEPAYWDHPSRCPLSHSEEAYRHCILLPLFPQMTEAMQHEVVAALASALKEQSQDRVAV